MMKIPGSIMEMVPVRLASVFEGERYDATKEAAIEGFSTAEYDEEAAGWRPAQAIETRARLRSRNWLCARTKKCM